MTDSFPFVVRTLLSSGSLCVHTSLLMPYFSWLMFMFLFFLIQEGLCFSDQHVVFEVLSWRSLACLAQPLVHSEAVLVDSFIHHLLDHQLKNTFCHSLMISGVEAGGLELSGHDLSAGVCGF